MFKILGLLNLCVHVYLCLIARVLCQQNVLQALGNHGDRLSDLESKMAAVSASVGQLKTELQRVVNENLDLKQQLQVVNASNISHATKNTV